MLCIPLHLKHGLTTDALDKFAPYDSALAECERERIKQQPPTNIVKIEDPPLFQIQVANVQLERLIATATLEFEIENITFAEHFVNMKKLGGPVFGLHLIRQYSIVTVTINGLNHFPYLKMQVKSGNSEKSAKI